MVDDAMKVTGSKGGRGLALLVAAVIGAVGCGGDGAVSGTGGAAATGGQGTGSGGTGGAAGDGGRGGAGTGGISTGGVFGTGGGGGGGTGPGGGGGTGPGGGSGTGPGGGAGAGIVCRGMTCTAGQICVDGTVVPNGPAPYSTGTCRDNPCGAAPLSCSCASALCTGPGAATCTGATNTTLMCRFESVCASPETMIATPTGERRIADILPGDLVYSQEGNALRAVPVLRVGQTPVYHHQVMRVALADGAVLEMSAGHPTADGRTFGQLRAGDVLDGARIVSSQLVPYRFPRTYDILPASETGTYVAFGRLVGSTLAR